MDVVVNGPDDNSSNEWNDRPAIDIFQALAHFRDVRENGNELCVLPCESSRVESSERSLFVLLVLFSVVVVAAVAVVVVVVVVVVFCCCWWCCC